MPYTNSFVYNTLRTTSNNCNLFGRAVKFKLDYILCEYGITCHFTAPFADIDFGAYSQLTFYKYPHGRIFCVLASLIVELFHIIKKHVQISKAGIERERKKQQSWRQLVQKNLF